ncbi:mitochondrial carrier domain-containing protein [Powellomyces hirtus]|nr:mitochondrial carrier domain-containing protein [Powellomyces hirtus]
MTNGSGSPPRLSPAADLLFGSVAGMIGMLFQFPFDTIKVRLQSQPHGAGQLFIGPLDCAVKGFKSGGVKSFYKGLSAPLVGAMIENSALFGAFSHIQSVVRRYSDMPSVDAPLSLAQLTLSGFLSGALVSFVLTPVELVKCQLQVQDVLFNPAANASIPPHASTTTPVPPAHSLHHGQHQQGPISVIMTTLRKHGIRGLYHGHVGTFLREAGGGAAWFGTYELVIRELIRRKQKAQLEEPPPGPAPASSRAAAPASPRAAAASSTSLSLFPSPSSTSIPPHPTQPPPGPPRTITKEDLGTLSIMLAGALAGMTYNAALFPADTLKSRQQTTDGGKSFVQVARDLYTAQGWRGFYKGFGITVLRSAPTSAMIFATYELLSRHFPF